MFKFATILAAESEEMPTVLAVPLDELIIGLIAFLLVFGTLAKFVLPKIKATLDETPPDLVADLSRTGIVLAGGGALLKGLTERLIKETGMPVRVADDPLYSVVIGAGRCVENIEMLQQILAPESR